MGKYLYTNGQGETQEIPLVLPPLELTEVQVLENSNVVTVASTAGVWPGMAYFGPKMKDGVRAFVQNKLSATKLEIWGAKWDPETGFYTLSAENGRATADDNTAGNLATVCGFGRLPDVVFRPGGLWSNNFESTGVTNIPVKVADATVVQTTQTKAPLVFDPKYTWTSGTVVNISEPQVHKSDCLAETPLKRHHGVPQDMWVLVQEGGYVSVLPALSKCSCVMVALDAADED